MTLICTRIALDVNITLCFNPIWHFTELCHRSFGGFVGLLAQEDRRQDCDMQELKVDSLAELSADEDTAARRAIRRSRWENPSHKSELSMWRRNSKSEVVRSDTYVNNKFLNGWILVEKLAMKISSSQLNFFMHSFRELWWVYIKPGWWPYALSKIAHKCFRTNVAGTLFGESVT